MQLLANGKQQFIDQNGAPLAGGFVYHYAPGTSTPITTYKDPAGVAANANPIQLDSRGQAVIWATGTLRQVVNDAVGTLIWDQQVSVPDLGAPLTALSTSEGAGMIGYGLSTLGQLLKSELPAVVDSVDALRSLDNTRFTRALVNGYYVAGDGGGGVFYCDASDTTTLDDGGMTFVGTTGGRWKRVCEPGTLQVAWFGARPSVNASQSTSIQAAIRFAEQSGQFRTVLFAGGGYRCDSTLLMSGVSSGVLLQGVGSPNRAVLTGTWLDFSNAPSGTTGVKFNAGSAAMFGGGMVNINVYRATETKGSGSSGIYLRSIQRAKVQGCVVSGFDYCLDTDDGAAVGAAVIYCEFSDLTLSGYATAAIRARALVGGYFSDIEVTFGATGYDMLMLIAPSSTTTQGCDSITFSRCTFIPTTGMAPELIEIRGGANGGNLDIRFDMCVFEQATGDAIRIAYPTAPPDLTVRQLYVDKCWFNNVGRAVANIGQPTQFSVANSRINTTGANGAIYYASTAATTTTVDVEIVNNHISFGAAASFGIELYQHRGFLVQGNTIRAQGAASAQPAILISNAVDQARVLNNHSVTTYVSSDGISNAGTNTVSVSNTKAAS